MNFALGIGLALVTMVGFGVENIFLAISSRRIGAFRSALWMQGIATFIMLALSFALFKYGGMLPTTILLIVGAAAISTTGLVSFAKGMKVGNVSVVATIANSWGAITAVLGIALLHETLSSSQILFLAIIVIGVILVSLDIKNLPVHKKLKSSDPGVKYAVLSLLCWGIFFFLMSIITSMLNWFSAALFVTAATVLFMVIYGSVTETEMRTGAGSFWLLIPIGVLSLIALLAYNLGVTYSYAAVVAPIASASPAVAVVLALLFLKEKLQGHQAIGILMVLAGIILLAL